MITLFGSSIEINLTLFILALVVFVGGFVRGFTGFGSALVIIPGLMLLFGPREAVAMHAIMEIPVILTLIPAAVGNAERRTVLPMLIALAIGTPIGALALKWLNADILKLIISSVVILMVGLLASQRKIHAVIGQRGAAITGLIGGLTQGATGIGGPPVVSALLARGDRASISRGNVIAVMSSMVLASIISLSAYGLVTRHVLLIGALAGPVCLLATWAGSYAFRHYGERAHHSAALVVLAITALSTFAVTLRGIF